MSENWLLFSLTHLALANYNAVSSPIPPRPFTLKRRRLAHIDTVAFAEQFKSRPSAVCPSAGSIFPRMVDKEIGRPRTESASTSVTEKQDQGSKKQRKQGGRE